MTRLRGKVAWKTHYVLPSAERASRRRRRRRRTVRRCWIRLHKTGLHAYLFVIIVALRLALRIALVILAVLFLMG